MTDIIIDDQDLSQIHYNGSWIRGGSPREHDETVASSTNVGDSFTVNFYGNSITVYGTIDSTSAGVLTNYSVDDAPPVQMTSQAGVGDTVNQQFWKSPVLEVGEHHLVVTMAKINNNSGPGEGTIWFDYFLATDPTIRQQSTARKVRIGEIVGGVIGGVLSLVFALIVFIFLVRRRKRKKEDIQAQPFQWPKNGADGETPSDFHVGGFPSDQSTGPISPFPYEPGHQDSLTLLSPNSLNTAPNSDLPRKSTLMSENHRQVSGPVFHLAQPSSTNIPSSLSEDHTRASTQEAVHSVVGKHQRGGSGINVTIPETNASSALLPGLLPTQALQHIDSGARAINVQTDLDMPTTGIELPPVYSPV